MASPMPRKIYTVGHGGWYTNWMEGATVDKMENADLVVFTGGEDVNPALYGKRPHPYTFFNRERDSREQDAFEKALKLNKKMIGICRGAQLLCVLAGGGLVQHQSHPHTHNVFTSDHKEIKVTSTHHQRQYPWMNKFPKFKLLAWCHLSPYSEGEDRDDKLNDKPEVEIALYPDINALAIQPHPEMAFRPINEWETELIDYCRKLLDDHMK